MSKRRFSGAEYRKLRVKRQDDDERLAQCMSAFMTRSVLQLNDNPVNQPVAGSSQTNLSPSEDLKQANDHAENKL